MFKKLDFVKSVNNEIYFGIVLVGPLDIPFFDDCAGTMASTVPVELDSEETWRRTFVGYIVLDLPSHSYHIIAEDGLRRIEPSVQAGYIPYDHGSGNLKIPLSLIKLADKWYEKPEEDSNVITNAS